MPSTDEASIAKTLVALSTLRVSFYENVANGLVHTERPEFVYPVFYAALIEAVRRDLLESRSYLMDDLRAIIERKKDASCSVENNGSCGNDNSISYKAALRLFEQHAFQLHADNISKITRILRSYGTGRYKIEEVMHMLRSFACQDLQEYVATAANVVGNIAPSLDRKDVERKKMECWQNIIMYFGKNHGLPESCPRVSTIDDFNREVVKLMSGFRTLINYEANDDAGNRVRKPSKYSDQSTAIPTAPLYPEMQAALENRLSTLVGVGKGVLIKLTKRLSRLSFDMSAVSDLIDAVQEVAVDAVRAKIPLYFLIPQLYTGGQAGGGGGGRGFTVGGVQKMIAGSTAMAAYSAGDFSVAIIYCIKLVRFLAQLGALWIAVKIFKDAYVRSVYSAKKDPPPINNLLFIFLGVDLTFQLFIVTLVVVVAAPGGSMTGIVNDAFMSQLLMDELATTLMIAILGAIIASFVWRKTYFKYKTDGLGAVKSYADIMVGVCAIMVVVPFFLLA